MTGVWVLSVQEENDISFAVYTTEEAATRQALEDVRTHELPEIRCDNGRAWGEWGMTIHLGSGLLDPPFETGEVVDA